MEKGASMIFYPYPYFSHLNVHTLQTTSAANFQIFFTEIFYPLSVLDDKERIKQ